MTELAALKILIVEDEALIAMLIEDALIERGYEIVAIVDTLRGAMAVVEQDHPDLVLCDVKLMDGESGFDVADMLAPRGIPCLFISGNCPTVDQGKGLAIGCLLKPFQTNSLDDAVKAAIAASKGEAPTNLPHGMSLY